MAIRQIRPPTRLPAALAICVALALYLVLPSRFVEGPGAFLGSIRWIITGAEVMLLAAIAISTLGSTRLRAIDREIAVCAVGVMTVTNAVALGLLVHVVYSGTTLLGQELVVSAAAIWCTNVVVFALWFWELDGGGPEQRSRGRGASPDFLFVQESAPGAGGTEWKPSFTDYLYTSFTNAAAFSPTDTMPLTSRAKALMLVEACASIVTLVIVASRAVNIL